MNREIAIFFNLLHFTTYYLLLLTHTTLSHTELFSCDFLTILFCHRIGNFFYKLPFVHHAIQTPHPQTSNINVLYSKIKFISFI